jgi:hypothetical protein
VKPANFTYTVTENEELIAKLIDGEFSYSLDDNCTTTNQVVTYWSPHRQGEKSTPRPADIFDDIYSLCRTTSEISELSCIDLVLKIAAKKHTLTTDSIIRLLEIEKNTKLFFLNRLTDLICTGLISRLKNPINLNEIIKFCYQAKFNKTDYTSMCKRRSLYIQDAEVFRTRAVHDAAPLVRDDQEETNLCDSLPFCCLQ